MTMKLIKNNDEMDLNEIMQKKKVRFAFAHKSPDGKTLTQLHKYVMCRDYLSDVVVEHHTGGGLIKYPVYGFDYPDLKIDEDKTRLLITYSKVEVIAKRIKLLQTFEENQGWEKSVLTEVSGDTILVEGDKRWQSFSIFISIYSLILRGLAYSEDSEFTSLLKLLEDLRSKGIGNESSYLNTLKDKKLSITKLMGIQNLLCGQVGASGTSDEALIDSVGGSSLHDGLGIKSLALLVSNYRKATGFPELSNVGSNWAILYIRKVG